MSVIIFVQTCSYVIMNFDIWDSLRSRQVSSSIIKQNFFVFFKYLIISFG